MSNSDLSYANPEHPYLKRWTIRVVEGLSGRKELLALYAYWRDNIVGVTPHIWSSLMELVGLGLDVNAGAWPPRGLSAQPLVIVANHPFGIGDGMAILSLAEQMGRPYRILINSELLKVPEIRQFSLPIDFEDTRDALRTNLATRREALRLLREGVTIVIFPGGGVATSRHMWGRAEELPWKNFCAKLIRSAHAQVLPVYFEGQNSRLFQLVSQWSLTLRLALLVREFRRLLGSTIHVRVGAVIEPHKILAKGSAQDMTAYLHAKVHALAGEH
ncbi:lysophospholipid acyltransferase family protein [Polycladidibacter hongkongensis]|uniref:lysophospholipid acyltransferase family protein n=1 Tax=Polycladidibacter hongkongensis TaxID=1647556 RepID=UPI0009E8D312|nr:lysophospholipid acyltransferase family protein [Pseudovibrio hongkongensis]